MFNFILLVYNANGVYKIWISQQVPAYQSAKQQL